MCGICGLVGDNDPALLDRMLNRLVHRGPDEEGTHHGIGVAFGVRRLRVIDPTGGRQPVRNETGSVWAVMNGEIYNYRELREELIQKGHRFQSRCDTEVLVHLYEEEGQRRFIDCGECLPTPFGIESRILCCWFVIAWGSNPCTTLSNLAKRGPPNVCSFLQNCRHSWKDCLIGRFVRRPSLTSSHCSMFRALIRSWRVSISSDPARH